MWGRREGPQCAAEVGMDPGWRSLRRSLGRLGGQAAAGLPRAVQAFGQGAGFRARGWWAGFAGVWARALLVTPSDADLDSATRH